MGLHSGQRVELTLRPAQPDTGIVFRRVDLPEPVDIPISAAGGGRYAHGLHHRRGGAKVHTVEHLMSACAGPGDGQPRTSTSRPRKCPFSMAPRPRSCSCCKAPASSCRTRPSASSASSSRWRCAKARASTSSGRAWSPTTASSCASRSISPTRRWTPPGNALSSTWAGATTRATSPAPAPSASPRTWRCCAPTAWRWAVGWTTPSSWTTTRC